MGLNPSVGGCGGISGSSGSVGGELFSQLGRGSSGSPVNTCTVASWLKRNAMTDPSTGRCTRGVVPVPAATFALPLPTLGSA
ncbi:hypothetical protein BDZ91DRAFT_742020, partial [Kalaharituber pfeilii]